MQCVMILGQTFIMMNLVVIWEDAIADDILEKLLKHVARDCILDDERQLLHVRA